MRLTLIITSVIFVALFAYAELLAEAHDSCRPVPYESVAPTSTFQPGLASQSN